MNDQPEVIDCVIVPLVAPLRLATPKFLASLKELETEVAKLVVTDAASQQHAADLQTRLTKGGNWLEETRAKVKAPVLEQARLIDAAAKGPADRIDAAKKTLKNALLAYQIEQERIVRAAEAARQAELARLEGIRRAEAAKAAEEARLAAIEAAKKPMPTLKLEDDAPTETEKQIAAVKAAPAVVVQKPTGLSFKTTLVPTVTDLAKVPDLFVIRTVNLQAIRATFCTGYKTGMPMPQCAGIAFEVRQEAVTR